MELEEATQADQEFLNEIEEAGYDLGAIEAYRDNISEQYTPLNDWQSWISGFEDSYQSKMDTREFAERLAEEFFDFDSTYNSIAQYFDYEKWERDLFMGDYWENKGYIFRAI